MPINKETITLAAACVGMVTGTAGMVLGVLNTIQNLRRDRINVKVKSVIILQPGSYEGLGVAITNAGNLAVTIEDIGFVLKDTKGTIFLPYETLVNCKLPHRLEPRTSITVFWNPPVENGPHFHRVSHAYARTACGTTIRIRGACLKSAIKKAKASHQKESKQAAAR